MELSTEKIGDVTIVAVLTEALDASNTEKFKAGFSSILKESNKVVFEMSRVKFVDSSGCGSLLFCHNQLNSMDGGLKLCRVQEPVRSLFELVRMDRIVELFDTKDDAVKSFYRG